MNDLGINDGYKITYFSLLHLLICLCIYLSLYLEWTLRFPTKTNSAFIFQTCIKNKTKTELLVLDTAILTHCLPSVEIKNNF